MNAHEAAQAANFGAATARKSGRNPRFPYVPVVDCSKQADGGRGYVEQIRGVAFENRDGAVAYAQKVIEGRRARLEQELQAPHYRALRKWHKCEEVHS